MVSHMGVHYPPRRHGGQWPLRFAVRWAQCTTMKKRRSQLPRIYISPAGWVALALGVIIVLLFFFPPGTSAAPVDVYVLPFGDNGGEATVADFPRLMEAIEKGQGPANALASLKGETQGEIALPARTFTFGYIHYLVLIHAPAGNEVTVVTSFR